MSIIIQNCYCLQSHTYKNQVKIFKGNSVFYKLCKKLLFKINNLSTNEKLLITILNLKIKILQLKSANT